MFFARTRATLRRVASSLRGRTSATAPRHAGTPGRRARKPATITEYPGPREILRLILDAPIEPGQKLLLIALTPYATWGSWDGIYVTQQTLAAATGYSRKWVGRLLAELKEERILAEDSGGPRPRGPSVKRTTIRFCVAELERLAARAGRVPGGERSHMGARTLRTRGGDAVPIAREHSAHNLQASPSINHPPPPPRPGEPDHQSPKHEHRKASAEAERLLVEFGVYGPNAKRLAGAHTVEEVREGIARVKGVTRTVASPCGLLVSLLRDGGLARVINRRRGQQRASLDLEMRSWRIARVGELMGAIGSHRHSPNRDEILAQELAVRSVWRSNEDIAASGVLTDDELRAAGGRPLQLLRQLAAAAAEHPAAEQPARAGVRTAIRSAPKGGRA